MLLKVILSVASGLGDGENTLIPAFYLLSCYFFDTRITFNCEKSPANSLQKKTGYFMRFERKREELRRALQSPVELGIL